ncbi:unnamed protein product [Rotaria socialis]|uniref:Mitochondrial carrier protein n=1 Tax=Rotaria socialis TaxID=392032 RepID=A0A821FBZ7_9BILA|nr:unnamed protein product [Rotaria socialis]CAF4647849.1 unnamed protein product [Rotaria socialis]
MVVSLAESETTDYKSSSQIQTTSREPFNPHTTKWSDVNLVKFGALITVASTIENAVFYPFYVLKTREQSDRRNLSLLKSFRCHLSATLSKSNNSKGPSLFRGFWFSNMTSIPAYGIYLGIYLSSKDQLNASANVSAQFYAPFIAGALADVVSLLFYVPSDVIVQRLQIANSPYKSSLDAVRKIYKCDGMRGYYRGLGATFIVSILASSMWWMVYENIKHFLYRPSILPYFIWSKSSDDQTAEIHRIPQFTAGFIAGTVTSTCVNPLDVVKTRIQTQNIHTLGTTASTIMYKNIFHGLKCLWREEGVNGLLRGVLPKLASRGPLSAFSALVFELVLYYSRDDLHAF